MSKGYSGRRFQCPFFKWDEYNKVHCEGGVISLPVLELREHMDRYCSNLEGWKDCQLAKALNEHYDHQS